MAVPASFSRELRVEEDLEEQEFREFMEYIRSHASALTIQDRSMNDPPLFSLPQSNAGQIDPRWFGIVLRNGAAAITLRIRHVDFYVIGFRRGDMDAQVQWCELQKFNAQHHEIGGSTFFGVEGNYETLLADAACGYEDITHLSLGKHNMIAAFHELFRFTKNSTNIPRSRVSKALSVLIVMICEPARFTNISTLLYNGIGEARTVSLTNRMKYLVKNWMKISKSVMKCYDLTLERRVNTFVIDPNPNDFEVGSYENAVQVIGILKREPRSAHPVKKAGRRIAEVINMVLIEDIPDPCGMMIKIEGGTSSQLLFMEPLKARLGDKLMLTGPHECVSAEDSFLIEVNASCSLDVYKLFWSAFNLYANIFDSVIEGERCGPLAVKYIVYSEAIMAKVEVILSEDKEVYGEIIAKLGEYDFDLQMFKRESHESAAPFELSIPLLRSAVGVPTHTFLIVDVNIFVDHDCLQGVASFYPRASGMDVRQFDGFLVRITWN